MLPSYLRGVTVEVDTTLGKASFDLEEEYNAPPGFVSRVLAPRVTIRSGSGAIVYQNKKDAPPPLLDPTFVVMVVGLVLILLVA